MINISIKNDKSPHERFFGTPSPIKPEHCINFGRIGYATYRQKLKNKYKPRAFKFYTVGYAEDHSPHTYKVFKYVPNGPGEIIITRNVKWEHWDHPYKSQLSVIQPQQSSVNQPPGLEQPAFIRVEGLNPQQQELMAKMIDDYIVENKLCPM
jgi:hypothetical protein